jgi:hypothetical protein
MAADGRVRRTLAYYKRRAGDLLVALAGAFALVGVRGIVTSALFLAGSVIWTIRFVGFAAAKRRERRPTLDPFGNRLPADDQASRPS